MDELTQFALNKKLKSALASVGYRDTEVHDMDGDKIYTNETIKQDFITAIEKQDTFKPIIKTIIRLIETNIIVPAAVKPGLLNRIIYVFFKNKKKFAQSRFCMGFFDFDSGKIFILVENINNIDYWQKSEALSLVTLHEFQHMTSTFFPTSFMRLHGKAFIAYYKKFIKVYFGVNVGDREIYKVVNWIHIQMETAKGRSSLNDNTLEHYFNLMWNMLKPHYSSTSKLKNDLYRFFNTMLLYLRNPSLYAQSVANKDLNSWDMYIALKEGYKALKILQRVDSLCIQEIIFPGEVICIESEYNTQNRHFKLITQIK